MYITKGPSINHVTGRGQNFLRKKRHESVTGGVKDFFESQRRNLTMQRHATRIPCQYVSTKTFNPTQKTLFFTTASFEEKFIIQIHIDVWNMMMLKIETLSDSAKSHCLLTIFCNNEMITLMISLYYPFLWGERYCTGALRTTPRQLQVFGQNALGTVMIPPELWPLKFLVQLY